MATYNSDNYNKAPFNNPYGNCSVAHASIADLSAINSDAGAASGDQLNMIYLPAGAKVLDGFVYTGTAAAATSTIFLGIKYADGTSTGGSTGSATLDAGTAIAITATQAKTQLLFVPFTNDVDTVAYASWVSPGAPTGGAGGQTLDVVLFYESTGTK